MYSMIIFLPLFNSFLIGLGGFYFGRQIAIYSSLLILILCNFCTLILLNELLFNDNTILLEYYTFLIINNIKIQITFLFDQLVSIMLFIILTISACVHIFTAGYMSHDPFIVRFYTYLGLFTFFMIVLVTANNFFQLFLGWEGVGLCSYLLINFWFHRIAANKAAIKAMLMNRIADVFFIFAILLLLYEFKTLDYLIIFSLIDYINYHIIYLFFFEIKLVDLILFFLFLGAIGKSAQLGFHTWLPDAMEGPTPVSALLHAATMVTAGIFLLVRCSYIFEKSYLILYLVILIGAFTALFSAIIAVYQYDIKKIIAYSTCSQLGYMFFSCGLSNYNITLFHLFNHAFFKALLFLGAGSIISSLFDEQDLRKLGFLFYKLPFTYLSILIGSLAILGFPFLTGFYSKDILLEFTYITYYWEGKYIYCIGILTAFFTAVYSFKLLFFSFLKNTNIFSKYYFLSETNIFILCALVILSIMSIFVGFFFFEIFVGIGTNYFHNIFFIEFNHYNNIEFEFLNPFIKNLPFISGIIGIIVSYICFFKLRFYKKTLYHIFFFIKINLFVNFFNAGFFNYFFNKIFIYIYYVSYKLNIKMIEKGFFEFFGPIGFYLWLRQLSLFSRALSPFFLNLIMLIIYYFIWIILVFSLIFIYNLNYSIFLILSFYYLWDRICIIKL